MPMITDNKNIVGFADDSYKFLINSKSISPVMAKSFAISRY